MNIKLKIICASSWALMSLVSEAATQELWTLGTSKEGGWFDNNKVWENTPTTDDGRLCWAATASNLISWWRTNSNLAPAGALNQPAIADIFSTFKANFNNDAGHIRDGLTWWFTGNYTPYHTSDSAVLDDDSTGGGYYTESMQAVEKAYAGKTQYSLEMKDGIELVAKADEFNIGSSDENITSLSSTIINGLQSNGAIGLTIGYKELLIYNGELRTFGFTHAVTLWGIAYNDETGIIEKMYITDSDDTRNGNPDIHELIEFTCKENGKLLEIMGGDYRESDHWYVAQACVFKSLYSQIPEPGTASLSLIALAGVLMRRRRA